MTYRSIKSFRFYPRIIGYTYTDLPAYVSIIHNIVDRNDERIKSNYNIYHHIPNYRHIAQITQIYKNLHKNI